MAQPNEEFLKKLLATFRIEADEHIKTMSSGLLELEKAPQGDLQAEIVERVFREAHSLKGAARAVNLRQIESICQTLESVFAKLKEGQLAVSLSLLDLLHQALDMLGGLIEPVPRFDEAKTDALMEQLEDAAIEPLSGSVSDTAKAQTPNPGATMRARTEEPAPAAAPPPSSLISDTVRISTKKLDAVMRQVEELLSPKLASAQRVKELREITASFTSWKKQRVRIRPMLRSIARHVEIEDKQSSSAGHLQKLPKLLEHLESEQLFMKTLEGKILSLSKLAERDQRTLTGMTDSLLHDVKEMQLLPFSSLLETFPRVIREFAREQGKQVELAIRGGEVEIDRQLLQEMKDPLMHMLRNCIDHGIETASERQKKGKPVHGTITVAIGQKDSGKIEILLADDGAGIDADRVRAAASRLGIVTAEEAAHMDDQEARALIFQSGVSTSPIITDISGRGLGLAIVREKVEQLGGAIAFDTHAGVGTSIRINLPLTIATLRGVLVRIEEHYFVIPTPNIEQVARVDRAGIQTVENRETITLNGQVVSLVRLSDILELPSQSTSFDTLPKIPIVVLGTGIARIAFCVDEVLGEQEVLVKSLGPQLIHVRNVAGASVLGDGRVVPVLNVADLLKSTVRQSAVSRGSVAHQKQDVAEKQSILVVEDSVTSRSLLKNILESAGYRVTTAVDGIDAYTTLKTAAFDLVVSDVEMPRMDGFDLTTKIRADKQLMDLPLVLVTALGSREHQERGIDVGANAYIVKGSFDQSNLLEVVKQLI
jgi:two-component system chemotaxis sensor kinase CheA